MEVTTIRKSAKGEHCTLQLMPYCNHNTDTVVLCHIGKGAGIGQKCTDLSAVYGCSACHDIIDGRVKTDISKVELLELQIRALERTHARLIERGIIRVCT